MSLKTTFMSALALIAFAGNSVLCRLALSDSSIHPASFTSIRLLSGALTLLLLVWLSNLAKDDDLTKGQANISLKKNWAAPVMLFAYAALFSFAYITLDTGVGALILFGSVQITMVLINLFRGNRLSAFEWLGLLLACSGLVYLVFPELSKPSVIGFMMMSVAGIAWGVYTVLGQGSQDPLTDTASNFVKTIPLTIVLVLPFLDQISVSPFQNEIVARAWLLAISSGAITSGVGYAIWYSALRNLNTSQAGVLQLLVPILAAIGGVAFAGELLTHRLMVASFLTLGGILMVVAAKNKAT